MRRLLLSALVIPGILFAEQMTLIQNDFLVNEYAWWDEADSEPPVSIPKEEAITPKEPVKQTPTPPKPKLKPTPKGYNFDNILTLEARLNSKIIGQEEAIKATVDSILPYTIEIHDPNKPIATLLFIGSTGIGKTELAKELAKELSYGSKRNFIRINMSEYSLDDGVSKIIGSGLGYKDSEKGGILANAILENPYSVVLLDEFEKASPLVHKLFLNIFDEGYFTGGTGTHINCHHCIFIATTNLGADKLQQAFESDVEYDDILPYLETELMKKLSPELYNRVEPILFKMITEEGLLNIARNKLFILTDRISKVKGLRIEFDTSVYDYLLTYGYNVKLGARPINRIIDKEINSVLTRFLIINKPIKDTTLVVTHDGEQFIVAPYEREDQ